MKIDAETRAHFATISTRYAFAHGRCKRQVRGSPERIVKSACRHLLTIRQNGCECRKDGQKGTGELT
jgi:hypothetical protein